MTLRVLVADDQEIVRVGLATVLALHEGVQVVAQAADGREAVVLAATHHPDVALLDVRMPHLDGIGATRLLAGPGVAAPLPVVVMTTFDTDEHVYGALRAGARGFLLKGASPDTVVEALRAAVRGDAIIDPAVTGRLLATLADKTSRPPAEPVDPLTDREEEVLRAVASGLSNAEVATRLHVSLSTVKFHCAALTSKLGVRNRVELAIWAYETGRIRARPPR